SRRTRAHDQTRVPGVVDNRHLHRMEMIGHEAVLPRQYAISTAGDMSARADRGTRSARNRHTPSQIESAIDLAERRPRLDRECPLIRVEINRPHFGKIHDDLRLRIVDEILEAVAAAADRYSCSSRSDRIAQDTGNLIRGT